MVEMENQDSIPETFLMKAVIVPVVFLMVEMENQDSILETFLMKAVIVPVVFLMIILDSIQDHQGQDLIQDTVLDLRVTDQTVNRMETLVLILDLLDLILEYLEEQLQELLVSGLQSSLLMIMK